MKRTPKYFIEVKIVADRLHDIQELMDGYASEGFVSDGRIQSNDDDIYWAFMSLDAGLITPPAVNVSKLSN